ncbi:fibronectin type III domain-containing protein [Paenibacillus sp. CF384]|uniref:fibronectin type III domain-containing protein n=1 Tax=Paenibacillus sp. CF384 TaxID=1884382 RepID=UPI00089A5349|nr:fibronectin type III domain-containing protein [Paenibacillus sp. CF384]SDW48364.1 Chitodextrinase [Paenibacillus sp. CF384]
MAESWIPLPVKTSTTPGAGNAGGEGGQWPQGIAISQSDPNFMLYGTDVGGLYRSTDGGANWEPANIGYDSRGNSGVAIDPRNANRAIAVGANSGPSAWNGLYLTTDKGLSWTSVRPENISGYRDFRDQIAYDPSSYDAVAGYTKTVYWSRVASDITSWGTPTVDPAIYKSTDGGSTWTKLASTSTYAGGILRVHPTSGAIYSATSTGFYKSTNGGVTFTLKSSGAANGLDIVPTSGYGNYVFLSKADGLYKSIDSGETFVKVTSSTYPTINPYNLKVSPVDPNRMAIAANEGAYDHKRYYTSDGGATWTVSTYDNSKSVIPYNNRQAVFTWHPTNASVVWSFGGDYMTKSTDGGATWVWANNGNNGIMTGGYFSFNVYNDNIAYLGSQDYDGMLTTDGGATWKITNLMQQVWGGWVYGAYAATGNLYYGGVPPVGNYNGPRNLFITRDNGGTITNTGIVLSGDPVSYQDPVNSSILFAWNKRSTDNGYNWTTMSGATGVFTHNPTGSKELYGANGSSLVRSTTQGASWTTLSTLPADILDVQYDQVRNRVYAVTQDRLYKYDISTSTLTEITSSVPVDQMGNRHIITVAVDPGNTDIVYVGGPGNTYTTDASVVRSTDGGLTWTILTRNTRVPNPQFGKDGAREAGVIRVQPSTGYAFVGTGCFGIWKIARPSGSSDTSAPTTPTALTSTSHTDTTVSLSWTASTDNVGVTAYDVYYGTTLAGSTSSTSYTVTGLTNATAYSFTVKAKDAAGNVSAASSAVNVTTSASSGYTENFDDNLAQNWSADSANWSATAGAYKQTSSTSYQKAIYNGATWDSSYAYSVKLYSPYGSSTNKYGVLYNYVDANNYYELTLAPASTNANLYKIVGGTRTLVQSVPFTGAQNTWYTVEIIRNAGNTTVKVNGTTYFSGVSQTELGAGKIGVSAEWNTASFDDVTVSSSDTTAPTAPTAVTSPSHTDTTVNLGWTASTDNVGVTGYDVYYGSTLTGSTASTSYTVTGLSPNTAYSFTVKAKDVAGNVSAASSAVNVTTSASSGYTENFDDNLAQNWTADSASWSATAGAYKQTSSTSYQKAIYNGATWNSTYTYSVKLYSAYGSSSNKYGVIYNYVDANNYYELTLAPASTTANLYKVVGGTRTLVQSVPFTGAQFAWYTVDIIRNAGSTTVKVNGTTYFSGVSQNELGAGKIGVSAEWNLASFEDVSVQ